jgi:hypothetical protein
VHFPRPRANLLKASATSATSSEKIFFEGDDEEEDEGAE